MTTTVLIADDHALVRDGLRRIIESSTDLAVAGEAINGDQVIAQVRGRRFDLLLLDMSMPGKSGLDLIRHVHAMDERLPILVLSMHAEEQYAVRALRAGASGYLNKDSAPGELVAAIRKVAAGGRYIGPAVAEQLAFGLQSNREVLPHATLSDREYEVFIALVSGESVTAMADRLHVSVKTVSTHKSRVMEKMQMSSLADMVRYAIQHRLIEDPDLPR